jgi:hypothetical protein
MRRLIDVARAEKIRKVIAYTLPENAGMLALFRHFHFATGSSSERSLIRATLDLHAAGPAGSSMA